MRTSSGPRCHISLCLLVPAQVIVSLIQPPGLFQPAHVVPSDTRLQATMCTLSRSSAHGVEPQCKKQSGTGSTRLADLANESKLQKPGQQISSTEMSPDFRTRLQVHRLYSIGIPCEIPKQNSLCFWKPYILFNQKRKLGKGKARTRQSS